jgi:hypothetical protein
MGYTRFSGEDFFSRSCRRETAAETAAPRFGMRKERIVHGPSLAWFLLFRKKLPSFPPDRLNPKANRSNVALEHHRVGRLDRASQRYRRILDKALDHPTPSIGSGSSPLRAATATRRSPHRPRHGSARHRSQVGTRVAALEAHGAQIQGL